VSYTPVLKARPSELSALNDARSRNGTDLLPLIELVPHTGNGARGRLSEVLYSLEQVALAWPRTHYLDVRLLSGGTASDRVSAWETVAYGVTAGAAAALGRGLVPVLAIDDPPEVVAAARPLAVAAERVGVRLRLSRGEPPDPFVADHAAALAVRAGVHAYAADLLLDWADSPTALRLDELYGLTRAVVAAVGVGWNRVVLLGTAAPATIDEVGYQRFLRREWWLWLRLRDDGCLGVEFGDYAGFGVPNPGGGIARIATIRYSRGDMLHVFKYRTGEGLLGYRRCAQDIVGDDELFAGADFSTGDAALAAVAGGEGAKNGNATVWRTVALQHHLALVQAELANPPAAPPAGTDLGGLGPVSGGRRR